ncbi:MAG: hypothetical protein ABWY83_04665 [Actinomycetota bacterium]
MKRVAGSREPDDLHRRTAVDIGLPKRVIEIEPASLPIPEPAPILEPSVDPQPEPEPEPVRIPEPAPEPTER